MSKLADVAQHLNCSQQALSKLIDDGVITKKPRGKYNIDEVRLEYIKHFRAIASGRAAAGDLDLGAERARLAKEQADAKEMENAIERGDLVYIELVAKDFEKQLLKAKTKLLALPSKIAAEVHASANVKEAKLLIEMNMKDALSDLVGYGKQAAE